MPVRQRQLTKSRENSIIEFEGGECTMHYTGHKGVR